MRSLLLLLTFSFSIEAQVSSEASLLNQERQSEAQSTTNLEKEDVVLDGFVVKFIPVFRFLLG